MASEEVINSLWEIANENSDENIELTEFQKELNNNIDIKIKSMSIDDSIKNISKEHDRTLLVILNHAKANPQSLGQMTGNKFVISDAVISKAVKTVKYENRFIPGTQEYNQRISKETNTNISNDIILTEKVIETMVNNYEKLTYDERKAVLDNYDKLSQEQRDKIDRGIDKSLEETKSRMTEGDREKCKQAQKDRDEAIKAKKIIDKVNSGESISEEDKNFLQEFSQKNPNIVIFNSNGNIVEGSQDNLIKKAKDESKKIQSIVDLTRIRNSIKLLEKSTEGLSEYQSDMLKKDLLELGLDYESSINNTEETMLKLEKMKKEINSEKSKQESENSEYSEKIEDNGDLKQLKYFDNLVNSYPQNDKNEILNEFQQGNSTKTVLNFETEELSQTLNIYKDYFADFDEETINELKDMDISEIQDGIRDDFIQMKVDGEISKEVYKALDVMLKNITEDTKNILLDPVKRDTFFEKIQSDIQSQKDTELINDSELIEIFKQASVDLEVGEMQEERTEETQDNSSLLENDHMDTEYIVNGVAMNIDEQWLQFFQDAQERGEDLEEAYENYKKEQEIEEIESKAVQEEKKEDKSQEEQTQEAVVVEEDGTVKQPAVEDIEIDDDSLEVDENEFFDLESISDSKKSKRNKKVAVLEKDEDGNLTNVQIFKPIEFFKQAEVTTHEFEETISELTSLTVEKGKSDVEKESSEEEFTQD